MPSSVNRQYTACSVPLKYAAQQAMILTTMLTPTNQWPGTSHYAAELGAQRRCCSPAKGRVHHDILVVGGGLAGLSTALSLTERGITDIAICEAGQPGDGASGRNGGFVFAGYSLSNEALTRQAGLSQGRQLHQWTQHAVGLVRRRIDQWDIDCQANDAGVLLADWFGDDASMLSFRQRMQDTLGFRLDWIDPRELPDHIRTRRYGGALHEPGSFHFHPLRYINGLIRVLQERGVTVYGDTPIQSIKPPTQSHSLGADRWQAVTEQATLSADQIVLTTGGYDRGVWPRLTRAVLPIATYIATTEPLGDDLACLLPNGHAVYDNRFAFDYYRPLPDTRLLWGGRISTRARRPDAIRRLLKADLARVFPSLSEVKFEHAWGGWMGYTRHQMPILGQPQTGLWHATGFGGHGMAPTALAGEVLAEAMSGDESRLKAYQRWQPAWAGGLAGRGWAQATYAWLNLKDAWRDRVR